MIVIIIIIIYLRWDDTSRDGSGVGLSI